MSSKKADQSPKPESRPRVIVLGGGFAGIGTGGKLRKAQVDVMVIDGHNTRRETSRQDQGENGAGHD